MDILLDTGFLVALIAKPQQENLLIVYGLSDVI